MNQCPALLQTAEMLKPYGKTLAHLNYCEWEPLYGYNWCDEKAKAAMIQAGVFAQLLFCASRKVTMLEHQRWMIDERKWTPNLKSDRVDLMTKKWIRKILLAQLKTSKKTGD